MSKFLGRKAWMNLWWSTHENLPVVLLVWKEKSSKKIAVKITESIDESPDVKIRTPEKQLDSSYVNYNRIVHNDKGLWRSIGSSIENRKQCSNFD